MGFSDGNKADGLHYWLTPIELFKALNDEFGFDYDPCPYPKPLNYDGLSAEWGAINYVNPPFGAYIDELDGKKKGPTAWARKSIEEFKKGKVVVLVYPIDKWVMLLLKELAGASIRNLGDVKWRSIETGQQGPGTGRHVACFVLDPRPKDQIPPPIDRPLPHWFIVSPTTRTTPPNKLNSIDLHD